MVTGASINPKDSPETFASRQLAEILILGADKDFLVPVSILFRKLRTKLRFSGSANTMNNESQLFVFWLVSRLSQKNNLQSLQKPVPARIKAADRLRSLEEFVWRGNRDSSSN